MDSKSTETSYPRQFMLNGQAAAPEGPCDLNAMYVIHHALRRDLARFATAVSRTDLDDAATWTALRTRWGRSSHTLHDHHSKEDVAIWPMLLARVDAADDTAGRSVLEDMEAEHDLIDPILERTAAGFQRMAAGTAGTAGTACETVRASLLAALVEARTVLHHHLGHEEEAAVALIQRYVTGPEWTHLENTGLRGKPSLDEILFFMPWVAEGSPTTSWRSWAEAGLPFRIILRLGRRRFARAERAAFGKLAG